MDNPALLEVLQDAFKPAKCPVHCRWRVTGHEEEHWHESGREGHVVLHKSVYGDVELLEYQPYLF